MSGDRRTAEIIQSWDQKPVRRIFGVVSCRAEGFRKAAECKPDRKECAGGPERIGLDKTVDVGYYYLCGSKRPYKCRYGSMVEQLICNQQVGGSSPSIG